MLVAVEVAEEMLFSLDIISGGRGGVGVGGRSNSSSSKE